MRGSRRGGRGALLTIGGLEEIRNWVTTASPEGLIAAALLAGVIETVFPPFPSEGLLILAAFAAAGRNLHPALLIVPSALASFVSLYLLYLLGRGPTHGTVRGWMQRASRRFDDSVRRFFERFGYGAVLVSRFLPAIRGPLVFMAGVYRLKPLPTAVVLGLGCAAWNTIIVMIGYRAGAAWDGSGRGLLVAGLLVAAVSAALWGAGLVLKALMERAAGGGAGPSQNSDSMRR